MPDTIPRYSFYDGFEVNDHVAVAASWNQLILFNPADGSVRHVVSMPPGYPESAVIGRFCLDGNRLLMVSKPNSSASSH